MYYICTNLEIEIIGLMIIDPMQEGMRFLILQDF